MSRGSVSTLVILPNWQPSWCNASTDRSALGGRQKLLFRMRGDAELAREGHVRVPVGRGMHLWSAKTRFGGVLSRCNIVTPRYSASLSANSAIHLGLLVYFAVQNGAISARKDGNRP